MTVFDAIRNGEEYEVDNCPETMAAHAYEQDRDYRKDGKHYYVLKCSRCGHESKGWVRDKGEA